MVKHLFLVLFLLIGFNSVAQVKVSRERQPINQNSRSNRNIGDAQQSVIDDREKPPIEDYKIISVKNDTMHVDTTLTIYKDYKYNYLRKDNFDLLPFANVGQTYTQLSRSFDDIELFPDIGARAKHFSYYEIEDINYYRVPTPFTDLYFKTTFQQGQNVNGLFTTNMTPRLNVFIGYRGLRSLGNYQSVLARQGAFRVGGSFQSKNNRYHVKTHFVSQDTQNEENGGLTNQAVLQYLSKDEEFDDRALLEVNFENATNMLYTKRFFLKHHFKVIKGNDSTQNNQVRVGHQINFTDKEYRYSQASPFIKFGNSYKSSNVFDEAEYQKVANKFDVEYQNNLLGKIAVQAQFTDLNYGYQKKLILDEQTIPNRIKENIVSVGGRYQKKIGGFKLSGNAMINLSEEFSGNYLKAQAAYRLDSLNKVEANLVINSRKPNFNFLLNQSDYVNYNWRNNFDNIQKQDLGLKLSSKKWGNLSANLTQINNHTYFGLKQNEQVSSSEEAPDTLVAPYQYDESIGYFKLKAEKKFKYWRLNFDNTLMYQNVFSGEEVFRVPDFVTRNALYYEDYWFKKALYLNTGFAFNYFTDFQANAYDPVLAEFFVQNNQELEGFYTVDFFFNAKVRQARIFFKLENFSALFEGNNAFSAPLHPYRDFVIRFGLVWNFFL